MNVREASILMGADATFVSAELFDKQITDFSIDSRSVKTGELFFALSQDDYARAGFNGTFADAHEFIADALARGAIAAVARAERVKYEKVCHTRSFAARRRRDSGPANDGAPRYEAWGGRCRITVAGKTTAKELPRIAFRRRRRVLKRAEYNTDWAALSFEIGKAGSRLTSLILLFWKWECLTHPEIPAL